MNVCVCVWVRECVCVYECVSTLLRKTSSASENNSGGKVSSPSSTRACDYQSDCQTVQ